jgi:DNA modification methylase
MSARVIVGDCLTELALIPTASVHCCVTSPPYLWLRDYEVAPTAWPEVSFAPIIGLPAITVPAQTEALGLERDIWSFIGHCVLVFRELRRVLRSDATLWLNMGDSYASGGRGGGGSFMEERGDASWKQKSTINGWRQPPSGFNRKDMLGIPWRLALAMQADGWVLRSENIWSKPNCMPESAEDRPTKAHEHVFLFSPSDDYYYDRDAIIEPVTGGAHTRGGGVGGKTVPPGHDLQGRMRQNERYGRAIRELVTHRNKRTVWNIPTEPFKGTHYATFPRELARTCILAGSSAAGCCSLCRAPLRRRVLIEGATFKERTAGRERSGYAAATLGGAPHSFAVRGSHGHISRVRKTVGWDPTCSCAAVVVPCTVIDPFAGAGTVGVVAIETGRNALLIEVSEPYAISARRRLARTKEKRGELAPLEAAVVEGPTQLGLLAGREPA